VISPSPRPASGITLDERLAAPSLPIGAEAIGYDVGHGASDHRTGLEAGIDLTLLPVGESQRRQRHRGRRAEDAGERLRLEEVSPATAKTETMAPPTRNRIARSPTMSDV
jgi:hypothetical protein